VAQAGCSHIMNSSNRATMRLTDDEWRAKLAGPDAPGAGLGIQLHPGGGKPTAWLAFASAIFTLSRRPAIS